MTETLGHPCPVCNREGGAVTVQHRGGPITTLCSPECTRIFIMRPADFSQNEREAVLEGGGAGGEYLDKIGKTDLATLTEAEWTTFCVAVVKGYTDALRKAADDQIPF